MTSDETRTPPRRGTAVVALTGLLALALLVIAIVSWTVHTFTHGAEQRPGHGHHRGVRLTVVPREGRVQRLPLRADSRPSSGSRQGTAPV